MTKQISNHNIHNILKFQIVRDSKYKFRDISRTFSYFQVNEIDKPDIILNIGSFTPSNGDCYLIDYKYHVKNNYFYCRDSGSRVKWEVEIIGFEHGDCIINFNANCKLQPQSIASLISLPIALSQAVLLRIIELKLNQKGYHFIHSAGINKDSSGYLFCSRGGAFKTTLCMDFFRRAGFGVLGDDRIILHDNKILSFPMASSLFEFMVTNLATEMDLGIFRYIQFATEQFLNKPIKNIMFKDKFSNLEALFFITRSNRIHDAQSVIIEELSNNYIDQAVNRILANNRAEGFVGLTLFGIDSLPFLKYELVYNFVFPNSSIAMREKKMAENLKNILKNIPIYKIDIPFTYKTKVFEEINKFILENFKKLIPEL